MGRGPFAIGDQPVALVSAKLCDVFPDGTSALVSRGTLNLTHRASHIDPEPVVPGDEYDVTIELDACAHRFSPDQQLRISVAGADWPNTMSPPAPVALTVHAAELVDGELDVGHRVGGDVQPVVHLGHQLGDQRAVLAEEPRHLLHRLVSVGGDELGRLDQRAHQAAPMKRLTLKRLGRRLKKPHSELWSSSTIRSPTSRAWNTTLTVCVGTPHNESSEINS